MKTIKQTNTIYKCSFCGKESNNINVIESCEKKDQCQHLNIKYLKDEIITEFTEIVGIEKRCLDCGRTLDNVSFESIQNKKLLKKIYNLIKKENATQN